MRKSNSFVFVLVIFVCLWQSSLAITLEEQQRRLARMREIAASSNGKIELTIIDLDSSTSSLPDAGIKIARKTHMDFFPTQYNTPFPANFSSTLKHNSLNTGTELSWAGNAEFAAVLRFLLRGEFSNAERGLQRLIATFPGHPDLGTWFYWRGECEVANGEMDAAAASFQSVVQLPASEKSDDALFRLAQIAAIRGDRQSEKYFLQQLLQLFPTSEYSARSLFLKSQTGNQLSH